jgi:hypothetical protein
MPAFTRTYGYFSGVVVLLAAGLVMAWQTLGTGIALAALVSLGIGTVISFRRLREHQRGSVVSPLPSRVSALPEKWQKALLGDDGPRSPRDAT